MSYPRPWNVNRRVRALPLLLGLAALGAPASAAAASGGSGISPAPGAARLLSASSASQASDAGHIYPGDPKHLGDRILRPGMRGHDVRVLQDYLTKAGYGVPVTGLFGSMTQGQVIAFERSSRLRANGVVTWAVSQALRRVVGTASVRQVASTVAPHGHGTVIDGLAIAPADAPAKVKAVIAAGNRIAFKPYVYGGGHGSFSDSGYDCSGSVSYALHGGGLISSPDDSSGLESYGSPGAGRWITIWANSGHTYMYVAGLRFDTGAQSETGGSRWTSQAQSNAGYVERHPTGF